MSFIKIIRTIRYLKARQVTGQIYKRLRPLWERPERFFQGTAPDFDQSQWEPQVSLLAPGVERNESQNIIAGRFVFLNREEAIGWPPVDWLTPELPKLWQYNLHYFEWLWALDYESIREVIVDWIARHCPSTGMGAWEPYPTSLRLMNWCCVCFGKFRKQTEEDEDFMRQLWGNAFLQAEWLCDHLETHILGNHLFENGAALAVMGSCFSGASADRWLETGLDILGKQIPEQILSDGMHFELSPMYHCRMTYVMALLANTGNADVRELVTSHLKRMLGALSIVCHPDGDIALLNDSAFGIYCHPRQLLGHCNDLLGKDFSSGSHGCFALPDAGYYGWRGLGGDYVICDAGKIGPDYIPGHAHADIFNYELSLNGHRVIVDAGVHDYERSDMRRYCRSTGAHNTVEVEGEDQSEMWAAFRVARRGRPRQIEWLPATDSFTLSGWHDGYRRLSSKSVHHRKFNWHQQGTLLVEDIVRSQTVVTVVSRIHLHPDCRVDTNDRDSIRIEYPGGRFTIKLHSDTQMYLEKSLYCPQFGVTKENTCVTLSARGSTVSFQYTVSKDT